MKWSSGASFPELALENIHGRAVTIPDKTSQCVHLQFRVRRMSDLQPPFADICQKTS